MKKEIKFYKTQLRNNIIMGLISLFLIFVVPILFKIFFIILFFVCIIKGQILKYKFDKAKAGI